MAELDRFGEPIVDPIVGEPTDPEPHPPCPNNGLWEDDDGNPRFCPECRPDLRPAERKWRAYITDQKPPEET